MKWYIEIIVCCSISMTLWVILRYLFWDITGGLIIIPMVIIGFLIGYSIEDIVDKWGKV